MRSTKPTRRVHPSRRPHYRPHMLTLEERLPLGDGVLGLLVGAALLPPHAAAAAVVPPSTGEPGVSVVGQVSNLSVWPDRLETCPTEAFADAPSAALAAPDWDPLTDPFAPAARRCHDTLPVSPKREQGPDASPSLALRANEGVAPLPSRAPAFVAAGPRADGALLATLVGMRTNAAPQTGTATPAQEAQVQKHFGQLPLYFEQNVGQTDASVHFFARGPGYGLYLTSTEAVVVLQQPGEAAPVDAHGLQPVGVPGRESMAPAATAQDAPEPAAVVRLQFVGANADSAVTGREEQPGKVNYFLGNDPNKWHTNIATFGRVQYDDVYPGIDLVWYGHQGQLEYDFVVAPGADPAQVRLRFAGAERLELDAAGDLVATAGGQELRQRAPFVYQEVGGQRQEVASRFVLDGQQVRFAVGAYDAALPLVIDPVLSYSTYLGGSGGDGGSGVAVDPATGDILLTGDTNSANFPTANPLQGVNGGQYDVILTRLNASGSALVFSTYLGGSRSDGGNYLAVDPASGDILLTGGTQSADFPTANAFQPSFGGGSCPLTPCTDAFVARLRASGSALVYSTYLGGNSWDGGTALAVDPASGDALLTGQTFSANFPTANPLQATRGGGYDAFVTRLSASGSALVYSTYLGGSSADYGTGIAVDPASGDVLLAGYTNSANFPTANPLQATNRGFNDVFVARLNPTGSALVFSTYLGGSGMDEDYALAVDAASGDILLTGYTKSPDFPTANPLQAACAGGLTSPCHDVFVARLRANGSALAFSTYLGGGRDEYGYALAVDPANGHVLLTGETGSTNFPTANPFQPAYGGSTNDAFVTRLNATGSALVYSTYLGGSRFDRGWALAVDPASGDALLTGGTSSTDFPTANPLQASTGGGWDAFVARVGSAPAAYYHVYPDSGQVQAGMPIDLYVFALDAQFNVIEDYTGLILFYATDPQATTPVYYQFQRPNPGYASFPGGLTFHTPGLQELYVFDWPGVQVFGYAAFQVV